MFEDTSQSGGAEASRRSGLRPVIDVAIIGAGPYGLAAAAHLRAAGIETRVFGRTMCFWERNMPAGMLLRSSWDASHISDPDGRLRLDDFEAATNRQISRQVPLQQFIEYGRWFQDRAVPEVDSRLITRVERSGDAFRLTPEAGDQINARRVVVAAGIANFACRPVAFESAPRALVSHSCDLNDLSRFSGLRVIVVGAGQSAVETAALLSENQAEVELIARTRAIRWLGRSARLHRLPSIVRHALYHRTDVGPALISQLVARPHLFRRLPRRRQDHISYRSIRPAASAWLMPRVGGVRFTLGRTISVVGYRGDSIVVRLDDGARREADHVVLATGYKVDIARYDFLAPALLTRIETSCGYPRLGAGLESSVPGLHFVGAPATHSFGPLMRFVSGSEFASRQLTRMVTRQPRPVAPGN